MTFSFLSFLLGVSLGGTLGAGITALIARDLVRAARAKAYRDGLANGLGRSRPQPGTARVLLFGRPMSCASLASDPYFNPLGGSPVTEAS